MKIFFIALTILVFVTPQFVLAAWWNPFSWFNNWNFLRKNENKTQVLEERIVDLEKKLDGKTASTTEETSSAQPKTYEEVLSEREAKAEQIHNQLEKLAITQKSNSVIEKPKEEPKTFTLPNGTVVDEFGNIIFSPPVTNQQTQTTIQQNTQLTQQYTAPTTNQTTQTQTTTATTNQTSTPTNALISVKSSSGCYINSTGTGTLSNQPCIITVWYLENGKRTNATISVTSETGTFNKQTVATTLASDGQPVAIFEYIPKSEFITSIQHTGRWCAQLSNSPESVCSDNGGVSYQHGIRIVASTNGIKSSESSFASTTHYPSEPYLESVPPFPTTNDPLIVKRQVWQQDQTNTSYPVDIPVYPLGYSGATIAVFRISSADEDFYVDKIQYEFDVKDVNATGSFSPAGGGLSTTGTTFVPTTNYKNNPYIDYSIKLNIPNDFYLGTHSITIKSIRLVGYTSGLYREVQGLPMTFTYEIK